VPNLDYIGTQAALSKVGRFETHCKSSYIT